MAEKPRNFATRTIHAGEQSSVADNAIFPAIVTSSSFIKRGLDDNPEYAYSRVSNPTRHAYETCVAALEEGVGAVACASGVSATATVLELLPKDAHVVVMNGVYGGTFRLMEDYRAHTSGLTTTYVDLNDLDAVAAAIRPNTKMIWLESPTNPLLHLVDIKPLCDLARERGILTCIDNTFCSPWNQQPITLGVDLVMHSASKYIGGHSDLTGGVVVAGNHELLARLRKISMAVGAIQGPFDCYLALRGLKTLDVRMERQSANALRVAQYLEQHPQVEQVFYPGLASHPQHALCQRQMRTGGAVVALRVKGDRAAVNRLVEALSIFVLADSLGGVESMINHSWTMSHNSLSPQQKGVMGISENLVRLSMGIEDYRDLIDDLEAGLQAAASA
ncbi:MULTISPECIES: trans-sulfuration enzyme family protein [Pseudomonas]|uniref:Aminotransferase class I/II-fold pyridoxal phosphate-dependent enzyme n=2 Tax=Pseudomonas TaxID=286 RepID=A0AAD0L6Z1_PSEPU|nr:MULTISPECIES: aminotransferase class I/II-fold pyridoxal phosphate-dependent enzyme [Pseudomonas]AXA23970.1 aminotransferase class I/II-fold pyridoxal phosphate-dependent enzyme [Pseudomonas putida]KAB5627370.1 aminotransferase class I/II-fold pyridoxal phosphate-dependent enzyme [Pseudomonas putida]MBH3459080.1 aminotransferase class I/II-fold pyridoxal phosphate-dependent enzyme [Pseudomonas putida]MBK0059805.1 aminotransferase class I/II-fold pyridoxal phosphate-dependent enzyme [Pseudomo